MHIEFMGLPGSGKSTIRKDLLHHLKKIDGERFISTEEAFHEASKKNIDKFYRYPLCLLPNNISLSLSKKLVNRSLMQHDAENEFISRAGNALGAFLGTSIFNEMSIKDRKIVIGSFLETGSVWGCIKDDVLARSAVFFEEGFLQKSLMFVEVDGNKVPDNDELEEYLNNIPHPDLVVYVKVDVKSCYERMLSRKDGLTQRLSGLGEDKIASFLERVEMHLDRVAGWANNNDQIIMVDIDNKAGNYDHNVKQLADRIFSCQA